VKTEENDHITEVYLSVLIPALAVLCKRLFKDHLDGGVHYEKDVSDPKLREKFQCVPKSNKYAESIFGLLDYLIKQKPNISTLASEAYIMFSQNKTMAWVNSKDDLEQKNLLSDARKQARIMKSNFKSRKDEIENERRKMIKEKISKKKRLI
jgi:hypothetical protein